MHLGNATIAVTGATGFLGGYLVQGLRQRGAHVIAVVRDRDKAARVLPSSVELRIADLSDRRALTSAFSGADAVISNAAVISFRHPRLTMRTNVEGTRNVFEALVRAGVERAIAISSTAAYPASLFRLDESKPLRSLGPLSFANAYGASKAEGERIAWQLSRQTGVGLTTFRPCGITGPFDPLLIRAIERVMSLPVALFPAYCAIGVVHAGDVAEAVLLALEQSEIAIDKAYNLQGCTATLWQIADAWQRAGGRSPHFRIPIPVPFALRYDDTRARRELHWSPRTLDAILEEAVRLRPTAATSQAHRVVG
ncbi:MAG: NAD-dependent epimerase/dehydratase [Myxococcaceae bacterium]|nr:NAD-dependent epimerase/dehydratase [Myxococcaceae bacterium]